MSSPLQTLGLNLTPHSNCQAVGSAIAVNQGLIAINISHFWIPVDMLRTEHNCPTAIDISGPFIASEQYPRGATAERKARKCPETYKLTSLDAAVVFECLRENAVVKHLDISNNHIGSKGAIVLASLIRENIVLESIVVDRREVTTLNLTLPLTLILTVNWRVNRIRVTIPVGMRRSVRGGNTQLSADRIRNNSEYTTIVFMETASGWLVQRP